MLYMHTNPKDWYWFVAGNTANVYSSKRNIYVPTSDADYVAWLASVGYETAVTVTDESEIWYYVKDFMPLWLWNGTTMSQPAEGQYTKAQLKNYNANTRFDAVTGGSTANPGKPPKPLFRAAGIPIKTDDRSRGFVQGGRTAAEADPEWHTKWFGADNQIYDIDAPTMIAMSDALGAHTNACYIVFAQVDEAITLSQIRTTAEIDAAYEAL